MCFLIKSMHFEHALSLLSNKNATNYLNKIELENNSSVVMSLDGFHEASKIIARFVPIKAIPNPPAFVQRKTILCTYNEEYYLVN